MAGSTRWARTRRSRRSASRVPTSSRPCWRRSPAAAGCAPLARSPCSVRSPPLPPMATRAAFQDRDTAALMGVRLGRIHTATFAFGSGLAAAAGALLGPVFLVYPSMGDLAALKAFSVVILGGLGNLPGATLGG